MRGSTVQKSRQGAQRTFGTRSAALFAWKNLPVLQGPWVSHWNFGLVGLVGLVRHVLMSLGSLSILLGPEWGDQHPVRAVAVFTNGESTRGHEASKLRIFAKKRMLTFPNIHWTLTLPNFLLHKDLYIKTSVGIWGVRNYHKELQVGQSSLLNAAVGQTGVPCLDQEHVGISDRSTVPLKAKWSHDAPDGSRARHQAVPPPQYHHLASTKVIEMYGTEHLVAKEKTLSHIFSSLPSQPPAG